MTTDLAGNDCIGWAAKDSTGLLSPHQFKRRAVGSDDVLVKITHTGVCYGDVVALQNKFGHARYPFVPGHEMVGIVREVGDNVTCFKAGDHVGVGTYVNSCRNCEDCNQDLQVQCSKAVYTYNAVDVDGTVTQGGYSSFIVVHQEYCFKIANEYPLEVAAPLLCAGITVYTPMMHHKMNQPGKSLGVVGLGGLGHMAVKFGKAFGLTVTVFSTSPSKKDEALNLFGADKFVLSTDEQQMKKEKKSLDFIIDTASGDHSIDQYVTLLKTTGVLALVGFPAPEIKLRTFNLLLGMRSVSGSATGGLKRTQEMLAFCAAHKIYPKVEIIQIQNINEAIERLKKNDVKYRFVIDIANSLKCRWIGLYKV